MDLLTIVRDEKVGYELVRCGRVELFGCVICFVVIPV